jgi:hypothetical protein
LENHSKTIRDMRILGVFLLVLFVNAGEVKACCGAGQYRIFPLGVIKNKAVCAVFEMGRYCEEEFEDFHWGGSVFLAIESADTMKVLSEVISNFEFLECQCSLDDIEQKSAYVSYMTAFLDSALLHARKLKGFEPFERMEYFATETEFSQNKVQLINDTLEVRDFSRPCKIEAMNCEYLAMIREVRFYYLKNKCFAVCSMGCPEGRLLTVNLMETGRSNALKSPSGMTYVPVDWHGYTKDLLLGPN